MKKLLLILFTISLFHTSLLAQWVQQTVPISKPITGIKFIDANTGWACTDNTGSPNRAYIIYTSNSGTNWIIQDSVNNATYGAISVINNNTVYCGGYDFSSNSANLKKTTNGGLNWVLIPTPTNMAIADMVFLNEDSGWSCSSNVGADVRTTTNGGLNWIVRTSGILQQTQKIFFLNYNTGYCGANTQLYKTTNAGLNWSLDHVFSTQIQSLYYLSSNTAWIGLTGDTSSKVAYTSNGGVNWVIQGLQPYIGNVTDIFTIDNQTVYACQPTALGKIYKTTNGGLQWGYQNVPSDPIKISFIDTSLGWSGRIGISKTTNGGGIITYVGIISINSNIPNAYKLYQNYPNPFNGQTNIKFSLTKRSFIKFRIYDVTGKEKTLWQTDKELEAGTHELHFDANDLSSGVYFYSITVSDGTSNIRFKETRKMILLK
ncbi:MAG TPA: T9SS type A sorting domain-containing protein [Ignavibacteria bacterium]|nr:T9SS type A sorting domain-containing protein [Ignavibacteria bacterium]